MASCVHGDSVECGRVQELDGFASPCLWLATAVVALDSNSRWVGRRQRAGPARVHAGSGEKSEVQGEHARRFNGSPGHRRQARGLAVRGPNPAGVLFVMMKPTRQAGGAAGIREASTWSALALAVCAPLPLTAPSKLTCIGIRPLRTTMRGHPIIIRYLQ
jgi:hypothetical protein